MKKFRFLNRENQLIDKDAVLNVETYDIQRSCVGPKTILYILWTIIPYFIVS